MYKLLHEYMTSSVVLSQLVADTKKLLSVWYNSLKMTLGLPWLSFKLKFTTWWHKWQHTQTT